MILLQFRKCLILTTQNLVISDLTEAGSEVSVSVGSPGKYSAIP